MPTPKIYSVKITPAAEYPDLVKRVRAEFSELEIILTRRTAEGYWNIGKFIDEHLLAHKERAEYGATFFERLAKDVDCDRTTLQRALQFYRAYPIRAEWRELTWEHYRNLITIKDNKERKKVEQKVIRGGWNSTKLREYLNVQREIISSDNDDKPVPHLAFTRGRLRVVRMVNVPGQEGLFLDLGFRVRHEALLAKSERLKEEDFVEVIKKEEVWTFQKAVAQADELFTYLVKVLKAVISIGR